MKFTLIALVIALAGSTFVIRANDLEATKSVADNSTVVATTVAEEQAPTESAA